MIDENTPYKLAEIIRDTWPNLYYLKENKNPVDQPHENFVFPEEVLSRGNAL